MPTGSPPRLRRRAAAQHIANIERLDVRQVVALHHARTVGIEQVFELMTETVFVIEDWLPVWKEAQTAMADAALELGLEGLPHVVDRAGDVAASAGVATLLGNGASVALHRTLWSPWRTIIVESAPNRMPPNRPM